MPFAAAREVPSPPSTTSAPTAALLHHFGGAYRVGERRLYLKIEQVELNLQHAVALERIQHGAAYHEGVRHEYDLVHAHALGGEDYALADIDLLVVVYGGGVGDKAAYVLAGRRVSYYAYGCHVSPPAFTGAARVTACRYAGRGAYTGVWTQNIFFAAWMMSAALGI